MADTPQGNENDHFVHVCTALCVDVRLTGRRGLHPVRTAMVGQDLSWRRTADVAGTGPGLRRLKGALAPRPRQPVLSRRRADPTGAAGPGWHGPAGSP